jgi:hypothetical protein
MGRGDTCALRPSISPSSCANKMVLRSAVTALGTGLRQQVAAAAHLHDPRVGPGLIQLSLMPCIRRPTRLLLALAEQQQHTCSLSNCLSVCRSVA